MRLLFCALAVSAAAFAGVIGGSAELNPVRTHTHTQQQSATQRVVVKLREISTAAGTTARAQSITPQDRISSLALRTGLSMKGVRTITSRLHALQLQPTDSTESIETTLARLRADADVEYAEVDGHRYAHAGPPNDPLYPEVTPANSGQWYMQTSVDTPAAVNAVGAWTTTTGSSSLVIADLDTGVRYDHPDLKDVASGGRLLPGYCFISDAFVNNGGTCLGGTVSEAEASDPGDWITAGDVSSSPNSDCKNATAQSSSWHGTRTAGILGALTNNATGIAGMTWQGQILPVRVLGKCGGFDSDIVSGMLWAAGIAVSGAPTNPTPARIINMSLGGTGACPAMYQDAIQQIQAKGVLVVVSAGNEGGPVDTPANCAGVAGVAGLRQVGTKVGFSSLGPEISLSAPAGNCVNTTISPTTPCEYSIETTSNDGATSPGNNTYTDEVNDPNLGTSFSAPIVSGIAALMSSVNSHLNSCQLIARLKEGASAFPQTSADATTQPPACHVPTSSTDLQTLECICTTDGKTCGAGMANANGAVAAALRPIAVVSLPASVSAGKSVALNASGSSAANGHSITSYQWTNAGTQSVTIQNGTSSTADVTAPTCGYATVQIVVSDDAGREDAAEIVLSPTSATSIAPTSASATTCNSTTPPVLLAVCPATSSVQTGGSQPFTATVANTTDINVTWQVNGVAGGNSTLGTVSSSGVYTAPAAVPSPATVTVQAVSEADQTVTSSTSVTITAPPSSHGGGAIDWLTLLAEATALTAALALRRYSRRRAASSQSR